MKMHIKDLRLPIKILPFQKTESYIYSQKTKNYVFEHLQYFKSINSNPS